MVYFCDILNNIVMKRCFEMGERILECAIEEFLDASYGAKFHNFVDSLVAEEEEYTYKWMEITGFQPEIEGAMMNCQQ